jgi:hypothetical protein
MSTATNMTQSTTTANVVPTVTKRTSTTTAANTTASSSTNSSFVGIGGEMVEYLPTGNVVASDAEAFYKKTKRSGLLPDKRADLYDKATQTKLPNTKRW